MIIFIRFLCQEICDVTRQHAELKEKKNRESGIAKMGDKGTKGKKIGQEVSITGMTGNVSAAMSETDT